MMSIGVDLMKEMIDVPLFFKPTPFTLGARRSSYERSTSYKPFLHAGGAASLR